jgi:hypothetical protein
MPSFIQPAYWGSLLALLVGVSLNLAFQLNRADTASEFSRLPAELAFAFTLIAALISIVLALRYYAAVTLNLYTNEEQSVLALPSTLRMIVFAVLTLILLLCNVSVALYGSLGSVAVMYLGPIISLVSLFCLLIMWIASLLRPADFRGPEKSFMVTELLHFTSLSLLLYAGALGSDSPSDRALLAGVVGALLVVVFLNEIYRLYFSRLLVQWEELKTQMTA